MDTTAEKRRRGAEMTKSYFLITCGEDGIDIEQLSEGDVLNRITPDEDGSTYYGEPLEFLTKVPEVDKGYFFNTGESSALLIEGRLIKPKAVKVETKFTLEE